MNRSGKELSGRHLHRFLKRFFEAQGDIDPATAERVSRVLGVTFSAVRLRRQTTAIAVRDLRKDIPEPGKSQKTSLPPEKVAAYPEKAATHKEDRSKAGDVVESEEKFNPYAFALVPLFVREGPDGLMRRLNTIQKLDHLRKLARFQQIVLPAEFRHGDVDIDDVRSAIVAAVSKRIADRRAAAG